MLYPPSHIQNRLKGICVGETRSRLDQFAVVDKIHKAVWNILVTLTVTRNRCDEGYQFEAIPLLAVYRMEAPRSGLPFVLPCQDPDQIDELSEMLQAAVLRDDVASRGVESNRVQKK